MGNLQATGQLLQGRQNFFQQKQLLLYPLGGVGISNLYSTVYPVGGREPVIPSGPQIPSVSGKAAEVVHEPGLYVEPWFQPVMWGASHSCRRARAEGTSGSSVLSHTA